MAGNSYDFKNTTSPSDESSASDNVSPVKFIERAPSVIQMPTVQLQRQIYSQQSFKNRYPPVEKERLSMQDHFNNFISHSAKFKLTSEKCKTFAKRLAPCIPRMRHYKWRQWLFGDIVSGLTLGTIHIPQCLGYSTVVQVLPAFGLYSSFFPVLVYFIFGSSHGISIGTVAVISLLAGNLVTEQYPNYAALYSVSSSHVNANYNTTYTTNVMNYVNATLATTAHSAVATQALNMDLTIAIATTASLVVGLTQFGMGVCRLGIISSLMSTPFNSAYMTATAIHTAVSQFPPALGFKIGQYPGLFTLPRQLKDIILSLPKTNPVDIIAASISIVFLVFIKMFINVKYRKKLFIPIPAELIVVIVGTFVCYMADLNEKYHMKIVGKIPRGFPAPAVPALLPHIDGSFFVGCITIVVVGCVECLSMAKILARKYRYNIDANQEFMAYGLVHIISSFFHCFPSAQSPPRTMIFESTGGKTQLSSLVAAALVFIVIVGLGPLFQNLPKSCLAAIVIVGVIPLIMHVKELKFYWAVQKWDFLGWVLTCLSVLVLDLAVGLGVGIGWNLLIILAQSLFVRGYTMSATNESDIFVRSKAYHNTFELGGIKIFRFESDLFFANAASFKNQLYQMTVNPNKLMLIRKKVFGSDGNENKIRSRASSRVVPPVLNTNGTDIAMNQIENKDYSKNNIAPKLNKEDMMNSEAVPNEFESSKNRINESATKGLYFVNPALDLDEEEKQESYGYVAQFNHSASNSSVKSNDKLPTTQRASSDGPSSSIGSKFRKISSISWKLPEEKMATAYNDRISLPDADYSADDEDQVPRAAEPETGTASGLQSFYKPPDMDFLEIDEDEEEKDIEDEVAEIRSQLGTEEYVRRRSSVKHLDVHSVILDCSSIAYIDFNGLLTIRQLFEDYREVGVNFLLAACGRFMLQKLKTSAIYDDFGAQIYPTVFDAVIAAQI